MQKIHRERGTEIKYTYIHHYQDFINQHINIMKTLEKKFDDLQQSRPGASTLANFNNAITGRHFSHKTIHYWFNILVDKEDYRGVPKGELFAYLLSL